MNTPERETNTSEGGRDDRGVPYHAESALSGAQVLEGNPSANTGNDMTGRDMLAVGVRNVVLTRGMLDKLEGPKYAERRAELRRKAREAARARDRQTTAASQNVNEAEESDESGEETAGERTTRVGRTRGGMKVAARIGEKLRREIGRGGSPRGWATGLTPHFSLKSLCGGGVPSSHPSLGLSVFFLSFTRFTRQARRGRRLLQKPSPAPHRSSNDTQ